MDGCGPGQWVERKEGKVLGTPGGRPSTEGGGSECTERIRKASLDRSRVHSPNSEP